MEYVQRLFQSVTDIRAEMKYPCNILGCVARDVQEVDALLERYFYLFTYRKDFEPLPRSVITTDKGWGCLARASQMLLACALRRHMALDFSFQYFCDIDDERIAPFSLHCMVRSVLRPGEDLRPVYWTPSQGCEAISGCVRRAIHRGALHSQLRVVVGAAGAIPKHEVNRHLEDSGNALILVPVRCGTTRRMTQKMFLSLEHLLLTPMCVGMVGGVPGRCYYIIGTGGQELLLYLDPHCMTQEALVSCESDTVGVVRPTPRHLLCVPYDRVDTSFFLGFFVDSFELWEDLQKKIEGLSRQLLHRIVSLYSDNLPDPPDSMLVEWPTES
uniref:Cysteine protease n=1 Tax=Trypanosoma congolense (strain IL3000) TaxID=1068625 RepID=G0UND4_TRYCI|nr:putative AUT2/APG4/ATG4 cysteine peptidase [Trypanosoma congolense IL3000]